MEKKQLSSEEFEIKKFIENNWDSISFAAIMMGIIVYFLQYSDKFISPFISIGALILFFLVSFKIAKKLGEFKLISKAFLTKIGVSILSFGFLAYYIKATFSIMSVDVDSQTLVYGLIKILILLIMLTILKEERIYTKKEVIESSENIFKQNNTSSKKSK